MFRFMMWGLLWVLTLGIMDIKVKYSDGLTIEFNSWLPKRFR